MKTPCERVVSKILPAIRAQVVKILINEYHMKQTEVAEAMGITQASVSQYLTSTRGDHKDLLEELPEIENSAKKIAVRIDNGASMEEQVNMLCEVCNIVRHRTDMCGIYEGKNG